MAHGKDFYFVTHSRKDHARVEAILRELTKQGLPIWVDTMVQPGDDWEKVIADALDAAKGILFFVSQAGITSDLVLRQLDILADHSSQHIIPIVLDVGVEMPEKLRGLPWVDIAGDTKEEAVEEILTAIRMLPDSSAMNIGASTDEIAYLLAEKNRGAKYAGTQTRKTPDSIFIVHGHDLALRTEVGEFLREMGVETVILSEVEGMRKDSLFQKFLNFSEDIEFAIVLLTADDLGAARRQYDAPGVADRALQFRARQNVILELGFFYGYLGWENVFTLLKPADQVFPNFELPSDLGGILFDEVDAEATWKTKLANRLRDAGFLLKDT